MRPDLKKIVSFFLIFASITVSSALVFFDTSPTGAPQESGVTADAPGTLPISDLNNLADISANTNGAQDSKIITDSDLPPAVPTKNLTDTLADNFGREFVSKNSAPALDDSGNLQQLNDLDTNAILGNAASMPAFKDFTIPDWDKEVPTAEVTANGGNKDLADYTSAIGGIIDTRIVRASLPTLIQNNTIPGSTEKAKKTIDEALAETANTPVPKQATALQNDLLKLFVYQKNSIALLAHAEEDPLKAALIFNTYSGKLDGVVADATRDFQNLQTLSGLHPETNKALASLNEFLGIRVAHAQFGGIVHDPIFNVTEIAEQVKEFISHTLLQVLINSLINRIEAQTVNWINNGGKPQFVTNWKSLLEGVGNDVASAAITKISPNLCSSFGPLVKIALLPVPPLGTPNFGSQCTLDSVVSNAKSFYNNFQSGGWIAYTSALNPANNLYGSIIINSDKVQREVEKEQQATQNKAVSASGFFSIGICADGSKANSHQICANGVAAQTTTPGDVLGKNLANSLGATKDTIVNAQSITGLVAVVVNSALNKLITSGVSGLVGLVTDATGNLSNSPGLPPSPAPPLPTPSTSPTTCTPLSQTTAVGEPTVITASGGDGATYTWSAPGGSPSTGNGGFFSNTYASAGTYSVVVKSGNNTVSACSINVTGAVNPPPVPAPIPGPTPATATACAPASQNGTVNLPITFTATGADGTNYSWTAPGATPGTGNTASFSTTYSTAGIFAIAVKGSDNIVTSCTAIIAP